MKTIQNLAADLHAFDHRVVDRFIGLPVPAMRGLSSLAEWEEQKLGAAYRISGDVRQVSGLLGLLIHGVASALHWFEERLVLAGVGQDFTTFSRHIGPSLNRLEAALSRPRYLVLFVTMTLLAIL